MTELRIDFAEHKSAFEPGEEITGNVSWSLEKAARAVELRLFWFTRGKGTEDAGVVQTIRFEQPLPQETRSFQLRLPDAPYSFSGKLISLVWALELIVSPSKEVARREFEMGPGAREIRLESLPPVGLVQKWLSRVNR